MPLRPFSPAASAQRGDVFIPVFQSMLTCDLGGQVDGYQLSLPEYRCACVLLCSCARAIEFVYVRVCQEPLHAGPGLAAFFDLHTAVDDQLQRNLC